MTQDRCFERAFTSCPETDSADRETYPPLAPEEFAAMEQAFFGEASGVMIRPFVRTGALGTAWVEVYVWDVMLCPEVWERFIIRENFRLPAKQEERFLRYIRDVFVWPEEERMNEWTTAVARRFPQWHFSAYRPFELGKALEHAYFASHRSGVREILYKAGLDQIAYRLDKIPFCNLIGTTPETIIGHGVSLRLLRILNDPDLVPALYFEEGIREACAVYRAYGSVIGRRRPSYGQWAYLEALWRNGGLFGGCPFIRTLYDRLDGGYGSVNELDAYEAFLELRGEAAGIRKMKIPQPDEVWKVVQELKKLRNVRGGSRYDTMIRKRKMRGDMGYTGERYVVVMPETAYDICREGIAQGNCVSELLHAHARGGTTVLFVRRKDRPDKSFVTMEVRDGRVAQLFAAFNRLPNADVYRFVEEYAAARRLHYDPFDLITDGEEIAGEEAGPELWAYAQEVFRRTRAPEALPVRYRQLTMTDCFPDLFLPETDVS